jgi:hypothetical protein
MAKEQTKKIWDEMKKAQEMGLKRGAYGDAPVSQSKSSKMEG